VELLGASEPLADAETVQMVEDYLDELGIEGRTLKLGSVGDPTCRPAYRERLKEWLGSRLDAFCEDCHRRYRENPLRVFDCKIESDRQRLVDAPTMHETLCSPCAEHFSEVRRWLDEFGVRYEIDDRLVRGLDYYQRTVFEVVAEGLGAQNAILGGGRYDGLMEELGGPAIPGIGFAMGMERVLMLLDAERIPVERPSLALVGLGPEGWQACVGLARRLRGLGISVMAPLVERPMGPQLKRAAKERARYALFVGGEGLAQGDHELKNMDSGEQRTVGETELIAAMRGIDVE
jgi:histidyl-tRNA synthetase